MATKDEKKTKLFDLEDPKVREAVESNPELYKTLVEWIAEEEFRTNPLFVKMDEERRLLREELDRVRTNYDTLERASRRVTRLEEWSKEPGAKLQRALALAQAAITNIGKDRDVEVRAKDPSKGSYKFKYATLAAIMDVVRKPLTENGLSIAQFPEFKFVSPAESTVSVTTVLMHESGEKISNTVTLPCLERDPQKVGIVLSYCRRYGITSLLGLAQTDEVDLDDFGVDQRFVGMEAPPPPAAAELPQTARPTPSSGNKKPKVSVITLGLSLQSSKTQEELDAAAKEVSEAKERGDITKQQREDLATIYSKRKDEIAKGIPDNITGIKTNESPAYDANAPRG